MRRERIDQEETIVDASDAVEDEWSTDGSDNEVEEDDQE